MKFGSRMDVFLPTTADVQVAVGQRVIGRRNRAGDAGDCQCSIICRSAAAGAIGRHFKRGVYLLPSLFTVANLFCGYACVVYSTQQDFDTAALFIGIAMVLDTLDGFFARLTNSSTAFGVRARLAGRCRVVRPRAGDPRVHVGTVAAQAARVGRRRSST